MVPEGKPTKPTLVVLAAGMGSRYGGLKQIDPVGPSGEAVLDYSVYDALRAGFGKVVFVIRREIETDFRAVIGARYEGRVEVDYAFQELNMLPAGFSVPEGRQKPWGTGHAILATRGTIAEPFAVINADDFYGADSYAVLARELCEAEQDRYCMVGFRLDRTLSEHGTVARGICTVGPAGNLADVEELTKIRRTADGAENEAPDGSVRKLTGREVVSMNMWGFTPTLFSHLEREFVDFLRLSGGNPKAEFFIPTVVNTLIESGMATVRVLTTESSWFGVTYRDDKPVVVASIRKLIDEGVYPDRLWSGL